MVKFYGGDSKQLKPLSGWDRITTYVQVEVLESEAKQRTGFTTANSIQ